MSTHHSACMRSSQIGHSPRRSWLSTMRSTEMAIGPKYHAVIADIPDAHIWYEDTGGNGPAVVLLHARTGSAAMWKRQLDAFSAARYRCVVYDRRQSGRTEVAPNADDALPADALRAL